MTDRREIRLARPDTDQDELAEVEAVLATGYLTQGPKVTEFEGLVAELIGVPYAFATTSATTALHLSLAALGIAPGDEVLVPDFTFPATANVVVQQGARPVLVDIDSETFTVTADALEQKLTARTRAMIPVHAFGLSADLDPILTLARDRGVPVIEDAACALATTYFGRYCGGMGIAGCFSFHPRKAITTGEGGMITTRNEELARSIALLRSHGGVRRGNRFTFEAAGFNYRLSDILAAVGVAQLRKLDGMVARRRAAAARYRDLLADVDLLRLPFEQTWGGHVYQSFVVLLDEGIDRDGLIRTLAEHGIETTLGTYALHREPFFGRSYGYKPGDLPHSDAAYRRSLALPMYASLEVDDQAYVADQLRTALAGAHARVS